MPRVQYTDVVINAQGVPQGNVPVSIIPVAGSSGTSKLWQAETGAGEIGTVVANSSRLFSVWLDEGRYDIDPLGTASKRVEIISNIAVGSPGTVNVKNYGAKGDGTDDTAAFEVTIASAAANNAVVYVPYGSYNITKELTVPDGVSLVAPPLGNGHNAGFYHNFNGNLFNFEGGGGLTNLYLINNGSYTGAAIYGKISEVSKGFLVFNRVVTTDFTGKRGWQYDVFLDGSAALAPVGLRSIFFNNCQFFGAYTPKETVVLKRLVHCFFNDCEILTAPQEGVEVGLRIYDKLSQDIFFSGFRMEGTFRTAAAGSVVFQGRIFLGNIVCDSESAKNTFTGNIEVPLTNEGGSSNLIYPAGLKEELTIGPKGEAAVGLQPLRARMEGSTVRLQAA